MREGLQLGIRKGEFMNKKQKICLWSGIILFIFTGIRPPWAFIGGHVLAPNKVYWEHRSLFYSPTKPELTYEYLHNKTIDFNPRGAQIFIEVLCVEWAIIAVIVAGLIITYREKKDKPV